MERVSIRGETENHPVGARIMGADNCFLPGVELPLLYHIFIEVCSGEGERGAGTGTGTRTGKKVGWDR